MAGRKGEEEMKRIREPDRFQVVVIGGGQAGLSVGYHLSRLGISFVILDVNERVGDSWRKRWDSLHLFTSARYDGLDGMRRVPRMAGVERGLPLLADGRVLDVANVVWCTGFQPKPAWLDLPVFGEDGEPLHERGFVASEPGLAFVGLHFLYAMSSTMIHGVGRDAEHVARRIAEALASSREVAA
jgi:NADH dehydrogenase FAD-containing subunit